MIARSAKKRAIPLKHIYIDIPSRPLNSEDRERERDKDERGMAPGRKRVCVCVASGAAAQKAGKGVAGISVAHH